MSSFGDALSGQAPPKNKNKYIFEILLIYFLFFINDFYFFEGNVPKYNAVQCHIVLLLSFCKNAHFL
jgi:hypothetical protein